MPTLPIPLFTRSYRNADESVLTDDAAIQYNGYIDELGGLNIRPGEVEAVTTNAATTGLYMWPDKNFIVSCNAEAVRLRTVSGETLVTAYPAVGVGLNSGNPVSFANNSDYVFMASGGPINYINATGTIAQITDADAPAAVTHIAYLDGYILAIDGTTGKFYWADVNAPTSWSALSFATAEANPDVVKALHVVQRQIYLIGTVTTEFWYNDGVSPFSRIEGGVIEVGCAAKYSVVRHDNSLIWLSHTRQFVRFTGTQTQFISSRYDKDIANFSVVSDCIGGFIHHNGQEYCIFTFPTENRTLVYNVNADDWSEWGVWDSTYMNFDAYDFRSTARDINTGKTFIGKSIPAIACLSSDSRVDLADYVIASDTVPFKFLRRTGWIDNGSNKRKRVESLTFRAKRGYGDNSQELIPYLMLRYRNDGTADWSNIRNISLGLSGDYDHVIDIKRLGMYKSRQWEISVSDNAPVVLSRPEIEFTEVR